MFSMKRGTIIPKITRTTMLFLVNYYGQSRTATFSFPLKAFTVLSFFLFINVTSLYKSDRKKSCQPIKIFEFNNHEIDLIKKIL